MRLIRFQTNAQAGWFLARQYFGKTNQIPGQVFKIPQRGTLVE
jgi:hypothetical protein